MKELKNEKMEMKFSQTCLRQAGKDRITQIFLPLAGKILEVVLLDCKLKIRERHAKP